ncbi:MAG: TrkH family potassium uptake protein [Bacteroidia bacterium]
MLNQIKSQLLRRISRLNKLSVLLAVLGVLAWILEAGFSNNPETEVILEKYIKITLLFFTAKIIIYYILQPRKLLRFIGIFDFGVLVFTLCFIAIPLFGGSINISLPGIYFQALLKIGITAIAIREASELEISRVYKKINPALIFSLSFITIIFFGALMLLLPNSRTADLSLLDALFTSVSAVCVTGLIVVDTATHFTQMGQTIIMVLIQIGGLGILTFASYFSYFFKGSSSLENQLTMNDLSSSSNLADVFKTLKYIIGITFFIEAISAISIYFSVLGNQFESLWDRIFFSLFHSISAFCNAGFSTLSNSMAESGFQLNFGLQLLIIVTFILGGLGFPIVANSVDFFKYRLLRLIFSKKKYAFRPWVMNINSRINLITTFSITSMALVLYLLFEWNYSLGEFSFSEKVLGGLFGATTPRTAGFNQVAMNDLNLPTIIMIMGLMWIGASPSSTGGGIKTSTIAVAVLNAFSLAKGKDRVEVYRREISYMSIRRAYSIMFLSIWVIGTAAVIIRSVHPELNFQDILFEVVSAFSTVGLSMGITAKFGSIAKLILMAVMFIGRVGTLTLLIAFFKQVREKNYKYPTEEIMIN